MRTNYLFATAILLFAIQAIGQKKLPNKEISHVFFAIGDIGETDNDSDITQNKLLLEELSTRSSDNSTFLFLGNHVFKNKFLKNHNPSTLDVNKTLSSQLETIKKYSGRSIFLPGNSDWTSGPEGLREEEKFIDDILGKNTFQPEKGCPLERIEINPNVDLIIVDSQWAIMDWNKYPLLNEDCDIKTKEDFYVELESEIKDGEGKTVLLAMHHPIASFGKYSAQFSFGMNPQDLSNIHYKEFSDRVITMSRQVNNVILLGAHDNNLQYFEEEKTPVIISGSGSSTSKVGSIQEGFSSSERGFAQITQYDDGSVWVSFFGESNSFDKSLYNEEIFPPKSNKKYDSYEEYKTPRFVMKSIYEPEELQRSGFYEALWGEHYRDDYAVKVKVKSALLDTLYGGLKPLRKGGGHQTNSLRLADSEGREFAMRSVKKSALRFLQYYLFKTEYLDPNIEDTYFVQLLQDYWTTANPYGLLTIPDLADAIGVLHPNPKLFYVPNQAALGKYNESFGDDLYFIEERVTEGQEDVESLGASDDIDSTFKLFEQLREKEDIKINERLYIRSRLFDNLIGDWDRHADQWKWAETKFDDGSSIYDPIPRDRDQVYSDFDGFILGTITTLVPPLRFMQRYDSDYNHVKWYNDAGDDVDLVVLKNHNRQDWIEEAEYIQANITDEVIEKAFKKLPPEIDQIKVARVKEALKGRLKNLDNNANELYEYLIKRVLISGTDKKDYFEITRMQNGRTRILGYRVRNGEKTTLFWNQVYDKKDTKEIWLYGLAGEDVFEVMGKENKTIHIKIIGGNGNDIYRITNKSGIKVYDHDSKPNRFDSPVKKMLSDNYDLNTFYFKKHRRDLSSLTPLLGFDPDDGLGFGLQYNYQKNSLIRNPFTDDHHVGLTYYTQTQSIDAFYSGEYAFILNNINLGINARYSSPNYTDNFFGFGNDSQNPDDELGLDFNRVRIQHIAISPSLIFRGYQGSRFEAGVSYENIEVEQTEGRFIETVEVNDNIFSGQDFVGAYISYEFDNLRETLVSKAGIGLKMTLGHKSNLNEDRNFSYIIPEARIATKIDNKGALVFASKAKAHIIFSNEFEFFQGASIGGNDGLRGFRQQRFVGKRSLYHSSDIRLSLGTLRNGILPISMGVYGGFDYGRVWVDSDNSGVWHTSPGGGFYFSLGGFTALNLAYFSSDEGGRFTFGLSLPF